VGRPVFKTGGGR